MPKRARVPVILLKQLDAQRTTWINQRIVVGLAATRWMIAFDNRFIGAVNSFNCL